MLSFQAQHSKSLSVRKSLGKSAGKSARRKALRLSRRCRQTRKDCQSYKLSQYDRAPIIPSRTLRRLDRLRNVHGRWGTCREQPVPMEPLAHRLRERARELKLSDAEVARRAGLAERRYGHYVRGAREPDLATLLRICSVLSLTPNDLLLADASQSETEHGRWFARLVAAGHALSAKDLKLAVRQAEALIAHRAEPE